MILGGFPAGLLAWQTQVPPELVAYPSLIQLNGKVLTVDDRFSIAEPVAVGDASILAVGPAGTVISVTTAGTPAQMKTRTILSFHDAR